MKKMGKKNKNQQTLLGTDLIHDPLLNKGTGFSKTERDQLGLAGLLPPRILTLEEQKKKIIEVFSKKPSNLEKYIYMIALQDRNETLFYRVILDYIEIMMPIVYTPTVGEACQEYDHIFRRPRGLYISIKDSEKIDQLLLNWPQKQVDVIVVTDGERILGLGDLGANGMGIPVGKLSLYTACAGIHPSKCLPITLDVGTNNQNLLNSPTYLGINKNRIKGSEYDYFIERFMISIKKRFPSAVIQFEDFANKNASRLLKKYQPKYRTFNDDIQGTAAVALAGIFSSMKISNQLLKNQVLLFYGAGTAGIGIGNLFVDALIELGIKKEEAQKKCWFVDSKGLVVKKRKNLQYEKQKYAQTHPHLTDLTDIIKKIKPTILIGTSGQGQKFTQSAINALSKINKRPIVFALSNPTSKSECTAEQAYAWSQGNAIFASGSPFDPVSFKKRTLYPSQGNNVYIFPGVGLGSVLTGIEQIPKSLFLTAAKTLSNIVSPSEIKCGLLYPPLKKIREVSVAISVAIIKKAKSEGLIKINLPVDIKSYIKNYMYSPNYD